jgi:hypothetical protein
MSVTLPLSRTEMVNMLKDQRSPKLEGGGGGVPPGGFFEPRKVKGNFGNFMAGF